MTELGHTSLTIAEFNDLLSMVDIARIKRKFPGNFTEIEGSGYTKSQLTKIYSCKKQPHLANLSRDEIFNHPDYAKLSHKGTWKYPPSKRRLLDE